MMNVQTEIQNHDSVQKRYFHFVTLDCVQYCIDIPVNCEDFFNVIFTLFQSIICCCFSPR